MRSALRLAAIVLVFAADPTLTYAQERSGSIAGTVKDSSGAILPGAAVQAQSPSLVGVQNVFSDEQGNYRFPALTPGVYEVSAALQGFTVAKVESIQLSLGQVLRIDLTLSLATLTEYVPSRSTVRTGGPISDPPRDAPAVQVRLLMLAVRDQWPGPEQGPVADPLTFPL